MSRMQGGGQSLATLDILGDPPRQRIPANDRLSSHIHIGVQYNYMGGPYITTKPCAATHDRHVDCTDPEASSRCLRRLQCSRNEPLSRSSVLPRSWRAMRPIP